MEHYVTIFDSKFILAGVALHESLQRHCQPFKLWIVALDDAVAEQLAKLSLENVEVIPLSDVETPELLAVKGGRTRGEYCWTLTPFLPTAVMKLAPRASRVTYIDADLYFFGSARPLFEELQTSGKSVLITEHGYAPQYDQTRTSGRFCVQFVVFVRDPHAQAVLEWWQARCLEWCFARQERGLFGDQKYLDCWPELFGDHTHILLQHALTLAPWNIDYQSNQKALKPAFYHFQGFRILAENQVKLYHGYRISSRNRWIYDTYLLAIVRAITRLRNLGYGIPTMPEHSQRFRAFKYLLMRVGGYIRFKNLALLLNDKSVQT
jgi:hypothetical protein